MKALLLEHQVIITCPLLDSYPKLKMFQVIIARIGPVTSLRYPVTLAEDIYSPPTPPVDGNKLSGG
jgi:hypothetical protein